MRGLDIRPNILSWSSVEKNELYEKTWDAMEARERLDGKSSPKLVSLQDTLHGSMPVMQS